MKQLSGLDASFLYMETGSQFGHVSSLSIYERPDDPSYDPFAAWRDQIERRLHLLEPLRRRLRVVPFALDHPFWIEDPDFDLDFHVRHTAVAAARLRRAARRAGVARSSDGRSTADRPLWETYVIEGLPDDRFAILTKVHHATDRRRVGRRAAHDDARQRSRGRLDRAADVGLARRPDAERR